ncbi:MAG TPA: hypothetical protein VMQ10_04480 [Spirochaetia bacterium]|nr:hypothetical protein [Spirochaetia bacterium]
MKTMEAAGRLLGVLLGTAVLAACVSPPARPPKETPASTQAATTQPSTGGTPGTDSSATSGATYVPTEEQYLKTFGEVQEVIAELTKIIAAGDYDGWTGYLTGEYIESRSSPRFLADASNAPILKKNGIVLRSLRDYFDYVVVRSRLQATLDDIQFLDETHVKAIGAVQGTNVILYYLVHEGGRWKVGTRGSGDS